MCWLAARHCPPAYELIISVRWRLAAKQWRKVTEASTKLEDVLISEGFPAQHPRFAGITVYPPRSPPNFSRRRSGSSRHQRADALPAPSIIRILMSGTVGCCMTWLLLPAKPESWSNAGTLLDRPAGTAASSVRHPGFSAPVDEEVSADEIIGGLQAYAREAHTLGVTIIGGTMLPCEGNMPWTPEREAKRQAAHAWIRSSGVCDGVFDADLATQDPDHRTWLLLSYAKWVASHVTVVAIMEQPPAAVLADAPVVSGPPTAAAGLDTVTVHPSSSDDR